MPAVALNLFDKRKCYNPSKSDRQDFQRPCAPKETKETQSMTAQLAWGPRDGERKEKVG